MGVGAEKIVMIVNPHQKLTRDLSSGLATPLYISNVYLIIIIIITKSVLKLP